MSFNTANAQVDYAALIQPSQNTTEEYPLFFIDFWATWCGPCSYATTYIDNLQQKYPTHFYAATISEEQPDLIKKYLKKHPTKLAVYADFKGQTFKRYKSLTLPYGVVLNAKGKIVWEGNPTDFSMYNLTSLLRRNTSKTRIAKMFKYFEPETDTTIEPDYIPQEDFELTELPTGSIYNFNIDYTEDYIHISGTLASVLAYANRVLVSQIDLSINKNKVISVYIKTDLLPYLSQLVLNNQKLKSSIIEENIEALVYNVSNSRFWDTNQINWNDNKLKFLIGEDVIEADNVTFKDFAYQISKALNIPFVIIGDYNATKLHDWQLHYKFIDLMTSSLEDTYGVKVSKNSVPITILKVCSK